MIYYNEQRSPTRNYKTNYNKEWASFGKEKKNTEIVDLHLSYNSNLASSFVN